MEKNGNGFRGMQHQLTQEDRIKGGSKISARKKLTSRINGMKKPTTLKKELEETLVKTLNKDLDTTALKNIIKMANHKNAEAMFDEMLDVMGEMKKLVRDEPSFEKYNTYLQRVIQLKECIWGKKVTVATQQDGKLLDEFKEKLLVVEKE